MSLDEWHPMIRAMRSAIAKLQREMTSTAAQIDELNRAVAWLADKHDLWFDETAGTPKPAATTQTKTTPAVCRESDPTERNGSTDDDEGRS